jgi:hypothetical protein
MFFLKRGERNKKNKKRQSSGHVEVNQRALTIADFLLNHPAWLGIAIKMASIGEINYCVVT